jgi:hypothetical protein
MLIQLLDVIFLVFCLFDMVYRIVALRKFMLITSQVVE